MKATGGSFPPKPLTSSGREKLFGRFAYKLTPTKQNPEAITVLDDWAKKNLVTVKLDLFGGTIARLHVLAAPRVQALIAAWQDAGVLDDVVTWNGAYAARLVRGTTRATLSAHAWGSAFDINAPHNRLGQEPAAIGEPGSVLRLVSIAESNGWVWGGRFNRKDGQHFELARV